ncbi:RNA-directed DNA polymerase, eukaryota, reverse transcriptase zinc-binding domain protein, partial [Tanacetum coccineum]
GSEDFISRFCNAYAIFLPYIISDHCPTILVIPKSVFPKKKPLKFANFIAEKQDFIPTVTQLWGRVNEGCNMFKTIKNLKGLKKQLKQLAWKNGNVFVNVKSLRNSLKEIQVTIDKDPHNQDLRKDECDCLKKYLEAIKDEEKILFQKAKVKWLNGNRYEGIEVVEQFVKHFKKFLRESRPVEQINNMESLFKCKLSSEEGRNMVKEVSDEEIKLAMFQIDDNKAPGPDDFTSLFCKRAWNIIGKDVCMADNIMLAQELFKGYDRKVGPKRVALKVDIQKAYDTVDWSFLENILKGFGFHETMVKWIITCVTTTSFSISINGVSSGYFRGGRGLRQGDSMSSYLFTLVMEILTLIIKDKVEHNRDFQYHFGCRKLKITNVLMTFLCFVMLI